MQLLFKIAGLAVIFLVCVLFGYFKSQNIKKRAELLSVTYRALTLLAEYINSEGGEISKILPRSFGNGFVSFENNKISFKKENFENQDIKVLEEFFCGLGFSDKNSEYERTKLFAKLIKKQLEEAEIKASSLCKLYNTTGVLAGVFLCIFFF